MAQLNKQFLETDLFKMVSNAPDIIAEDIIGKINITDENEQEVIRGAFRELGFYLTMAANASYSLSHACDLIRNYGIMTPDVRYLIMESSSELSNAVTFNEPIKRTINALVEMGIDIEDWTGDVPDEIPVNGLPITYLRNYKDLAKGRLINFRFQDPDNNPIVSDIPCIYDEELFAYMPLTNNPYWKYENDEPTSTEGAESTEPTTTDNAAEEQGSEGN